MKKLVLAMACVLSLGLLASCKQGTQDVNVKNSADTEAYFYYGTGNFSAVCAKKSTPAATTGSQSWEADSDTKKSLSYNEKKQPASIKWSTDAEKVEGNNKKFTLTIPYVYDSNTNTGADTVSDLKYDVFTVTIEKIAGKYYVSDANEDANTNEATFTEVEFSENKGPDSSEFTLKSIGVKSVEGQTWTISNITFKRK